MTETWSSPVEGEEAGEPASGSRLRDGILRSLIDTMPVGVVICDAEGTLLMTNPPGEKILGGPVLGNAFQPRRSYTVLNPDGSPLPDEEAPLARALQLGEIVKDVEILIRHADSTDHTIMVSAAPVRDRQGRIIAGVSVFQELTERKRMEQALRNSEAEFRAMFELNAVGMAQVDPASGRFTLVNRRLCEISGYSRGELLGMTFGDITHPADREVDVARYQAALRGESEGWTSVKRYLRKDGSTIWVEVVGTVLHDADGRPTRSTAVVQDVTERLRAQEELAIALEKYRVLFESFPLGITVSDDRGQIIETNARAERLLGVPRAEHTQRHLDGQEWRIVRPDGSPMSPDEWASVRALEDNRLVEDVEMGIVKAPDDITWISVTAAPIPLEGYGVAVAYGDVTERVCAEQALQESEERFHSLYASMIEGVALHQFISDERGQAQDYALLDVNPAFEAITGLSRDQAVGARASELYGAHEPPYLEIYAAVASSGKPASFETYFGPMDKHFRISAFSLGKGRFATVFEDVTEQRRAEQERERLRAELEQERNMLRAIMESTDTHLVYLDPDFNFVHANAAYARGAGYSQSELLGRNHFELFPHAENQAIFERARDTGEPVEFHAKPFEYPERPELGTTYWDWTLVPVKDATGEVRGLAFSLTDVTESERYERMLKSYADELEMEVLKRTSALRISEGRFRAIFEEAGMGVALVDAEGRVLSANPALQTMLGRDLEALLNEQTVNLPHASVEQPDEGALFQELAAGEREVYRLQREYVRADGVPIWVNMTVSGVREGEELKYAIVMMEDVTERRQAQEALVRSERLASAGRLAASLAHEINNPLQTVIGCLGLVDESLKEGEDVEQLLQLARQELRRAAGIVEQLRDVGRVSRPEDRQLHDVNGLVEQVLTLTRPRCRDQGVDVVWQPGDALPAPRLSPDRMRQVFLNLVLNAADAMPDGGRLEVRTEHVPERGEVSISFADTGSGIEPEELAHLFEPFHTTKEKGLGLGLYISNAIVEEHGGRIDVQSRAGEGTTFNVRLPA